MIQQMIEMLDPGAPHVVFEPNGALADGPLAHNRDRYRSTFAVLRGVLSDKDAVPFGSGDVDPNHPRAWMWGTVNGGGRSRGTVRGFGLDTVAALLGGAPTVLVADCEGGLIPALREFPQLLDSVKCVYYERDPPGDYEPMEELLRAGLRERAASLHRVWVHEASLPPGAGGARESLASAGSAASPRPAAAPADAAAAALASPAPRGPRRVGRARGGPPGTRTTGPTARSSGTRGLVSEAKEDGTYAILFDDEDERYGVPRDELRPIFVAGSFDWTHPFVQPDAAETQSSVDDRANSPAPEAIPEES
ncbi:hypothetical protein JL722_11085 [Aureococcus anophagefferens]|nr:hypothetical protein JL722_11085 [Aureococcus anophagefferens]